MAKEISLLHPDLQKKCRQLIAACKQKGIEIIITQTLRTKAEQDAIYAEGRTKPGKIVTKAKYPQSLHCWGVAFDVAVKVDGKVTWDVSYYKKVGLIGKGLGLEWGGSWTNFPDYPHFQLLGYAWSGLQRKFGTPERFIATWKGAEEEVEETKVKYKGKNMEAHIFNGKTFVELRELAEKFGKKVKWDPGSKTTEVLD